MQGCSCPVTLSMLLFIHALIELGKLYLKVTSLGRIAKHYCRQISESLDAPIVIVNKLLQMRELRFFPLATSHAYL